MDADGLILRATWLLKVANWNAWNMLNSMDAHGMKEYVSGLQERDTLNLIFTMDVNGLQKKGKYEQLRLLLAMTHFSGVTCSGCHVKINSIKDFINM